MERTSHGGTPPPDPSPASATPGRRHHPQRVLALAAVWVLLAAGALSGCSQLTSFLGGAPAAITSFSTSDPLVSSGDTVTLSWTVTGDAPLTLTLDPGGVDVSGSDHHDVSPTTTTDYTLHASNAAGSDDREVTVTVVAAGDTALQVNVTGLPAGAEAQVSVSDHATVMRWVRGSDGLTMLPPGGYTVAAAPVTVAGTSYQPQVPLQSLTLADGDTGSVDVSYASTPDDPYATPPDVRACKAGTLSQAARDRALARLNFLRVLVGLPAVPYDAAHDADVQAASLIFAANAAISHTPDGGWTCYTPAGASGAGSSNIAVRAKSSSFTPTPESFIDQWGDDVDVSSLGHRRWLVDPFLSQIAFGMVHGATNVAAWPYAAGSAVRVINAADAVVDTLALEYVAYPRGDFPAEMFSSDWFLSFSVLADPTSRWNNGSGQVDLGGAVVSIQEDGGGALTITDQGFDYAGQGLPNSLKWKAPGLQPDTDYTVSITGVLVNGSARSFSYPLRIH